MRKENEGLINVIAQRLIQENLPDIYETVRNRRMYYEAYIRESERKY